MILHQVDVKLRPRPRGCHLVTDEITDQVPQIGRIEAGLAHLFLLHTSAGLAVNENADPTVRGDLERHLSVIAPENAPHYRHTFEGPDDMPAHIKAVLTGVDVTLPIAGGRLALGTWQGVYLCEHRDRAGARRLLVTVWGTPR